MKKPAQMGRLFSKCSGLTLGGVVLAPLLRHPTLFLHFTEDSVEIVGFDLHLLGDLRGGDARVLLDQGDCLIGTRAAATPTPTAWSGG
jgi:hypothetical protein